MISFFHQCQTSNITLYLLTNGPGFACHLSFNRYTPKSFQRLTGFWTRCCFNNNPWIPSKVGVNSRNWKLWKKKKNDNQDQSSRYYSSVPVYISKVLFSRWAFSHLNMFHILKANLIFSVSMLAIPFFVLLFILLVDWYETEKEKEREKGEKHLCVSFNFFKHNYFIEFL